MCLGLSFSVPSLRAENMNIKVAVVMATFGTSHGSALHSILNIRDEIKNVMDSEVPVKMAFTSNIVRRIWQKKAKNPEYLKEHPNIPEEILHVKGPLATIADLQDQGYSYILVQPTLIVSGEEFTDLSSYVNALNSIKTMKEKNMPFRKIILGRPALGINGPKREYQHDMERVARSLTEDIEKAKKDERALVYMAHGNEFYSTGAFVEFEYIMRKHYPGVKIYITTVEGFPGFDYLLERLSSDGIKQVLLKPFMIVAGDHAKNDMAGSEPDSLKNRISAQGIDVSIDMRGLGENKAFARIFAENSKDALKDAGISF